MLQRALSRFPWKSAGAGCLLAAPLVGEAWEREAPAAAAARDHNDHRPLLDAQAAAKLHKPHVAALARAAELTAP